MTRVCRRAPFPIHKITHREGGSVDGRAKILAVTLYSKHPRYITTITNGFLVAIPISGKRTLTKSFRSVDVDHELLLRAVDWRDRAWRRLFGGAVPTRSFHTNVAETSSTGVPGVRQVTKIVRKAGREYVVPCIIAEVHTIPGKDYVRPRGSRSRLYSLNKYDRDEAIALGAAWRAVMIAELSKVGSES